jgi:hypothetical protein
MGGLSHLTARDIEPFIANDHPIDFAEEWFVNNAPAIHVSHGGRKAARAMLRRMVEVGLLIEFKTRIVEVAEPEDPGSGPLHSWRWLAPGLTIHRPGSAFNKDSFNPPTVSDLQPIADIIARRLMPPVVVRNTTLYLARPGILTTLKKGRWSDAMPSDGYWDILAFNDPEGTHPAIPLLEAERSFLPEGEVSTEIAARWMNDSFTGTRLGLARRLISHYFQHGISPRYRLTATGDATSPHALEWASSPTGAAYYAGCRDAESLLSIHQNFESYKESHGLEDYTVW